MSLLGNIVSSVTKAVTDPGALVSDAAKAVLPKNMAAVGDILGGIADVESGHPLQALSYLTDALKDLPQLAQGQSGAQAKDAAAPAGTAGAEPSPPPNKANQSSAASAASSPPTPESPKVNVQMFGREMVISIDDGTHTTVIAEKPVKKPVLSVRTDGGPTTAPGPGTLATTTPATLPATTTPTTTTPATPPATTTPATPPATATPATPPATTTPNSTTTGGTAGSSAGASTASPSGSASAAPTPQSPKVSVQRIGRETITSIDNGTRTTVIVQRPGHRPIVQTRLDTIAQLRANSAAAGTSGAAGASSPSPSATVNTNAAGSTAAAGTASTPTAAATASPPSASAAAAASSSTSDASSAGASSASSTSATSSSASSAATPADLQSLMALSPDQFMQAVTSGKIPDSVANSQSAMMQVQARMNQITQMNQLVTGMMAAMHQMEMSIIQNIRC